jgi:CRISPR-associated protein Csd2
MTTFEPYLDPERRQDAVLLFDVTDGNPNGDPDAGNLPRLDPETMQGLMSDVAIKRKVRDFVHAFQGDRQGYRIYVQNETALNDLHQAAYDELGITSKGTKQARGDVARVRQQMCQTYYDIRTFGAVMTTGKNAGQVRGPVQVTFGRSIDPVVALDMSITRIAITKPEDAAISHDEEGKGSGKTTEMGRKPLIPYGLYRANVFVSPIFARQTGFSSEDLSLVWRALASMWDLDRSAARGMMACRGIHVFSHTSPWGDAPAQDLLSRVKIERIDASRPARMFSDYKVTVDLEGMPDKVSYQDVARVPISA